MTLFFIQKREQNFSRFHSLSWSFGGFHPHDLVTQRCNSNAVTCFHLQQFFISLTVHDLTHGIGSAFSKSHAQLELADFLDSGNHVPDTSRRISHSHFHSPFLAQVDTFVHSSIRYTSEHSVNYYITLYIIFQINKKNRSISTSILYGEPGGIRTPDPRLRRPVLYPTELLTHSNNYINTIFLFCQHYFQIFIQLFYFL